MPTTLTSRTATGLFVGALIAGGAAGPARAATDSTISVDTDSSLITYRAGSGQENDPSMTERAEGTDDQPVSVFTYHDVAPITPGAGCSRPDPADPATVECRILGDPPSGIHFEFFLGDRADRIDRFREGGHTGIVHGGPGDDVLNLGDRGDVHGDEGDDVLTGGSVFGGTGDDRIVATFSADGDEGDDSITGRVSGEDHPQRLLGGPGDDTIVGVALDDTINGEAGNDLIRGGPGVDALTGGPGNDRVYGNSGDDRLVGGTGRDFLSGGPGDDRLYGNSGDDRLEGGAGHDFLSGGPGRDVEKQ